LFQAPAEPTFGGDATVGEGLASLGQPPSTLGSFDLLAFAEGGKGDSSDSWQRLVEGWQEAQNTWGASIQQSAADGWSLASNIVHDATESAEALVSPMLRFTGTDSLSLTDMQWRMIGRQMWQVSYGAVESSWTGTALAEMRDRFQAAFLDALAPWLPALPDVTPVDRLPVLEGGQDALHGLTEMLRSAAPPMNSEKPWQQTVDTVSRSLLEAPGVVPVRQEPPQAPARKKRDPVLLAQAVEDELSTITAAMPLPPLDRDGNVGAVLFDTAYREEREVFWLALAAFGLLSWQDITPEENSTVRQSPRPTGRRPGRK
jgi:hypothetical protein